MPGNDDRNRRLRKRKQQKKRRASQQGQSQEQADQSTPSSPRGLASTPTKVSREKRNRKADHTSSSAQARKKQRGQPDGKFKPNTRKRQRSRDGRAPAEPGGQQSSEEETVQSLIDTSKDDAAREGFSTDLPAPALFIVEKTIDNIKGRLRFIRSPREDRQLKETNPDNILSREAQLVNALFDVDDDWDPQFARMVYHNAGAKSHAVCHKTADRLLKLLRQGDDTLDNRDRAKNHSQAQVMRDVASALREDVESSRNGERSFVHRVTYGTHSFTFLARSGRIELLQSFANEDDLLTFMKYRQVYKPDQVESVVDKVRDIGVSDEGKRTVAQDFFFGDPASDQEVIRPSIEDYKGDPKVSNESKAEIYENGITTAWTRSRMVDDRELARRVLERVHRNVERYKSAGVLGESGSSSQALRDDKRQLSITH